jgi:hypothetical protein
MLPYRTGKCKVTFQSWIGVLFDSIDRIFTSEAEKSGRDTKKPHALEATYASDNEIGGCKSDYQILVFPFVLSSESLPW